MFPIPILNPGKNPPDGKTIAGLSARVGLLDAHKPECCTPPAKRPSTCQSPSSSTWLSLTTTAERCTIRLVLHSDSSTTGLEGDNYGGKVYNQASPTFR